VTSQLGYYSFMGFDSDELRRRYRGYANRLSGFAPVLDIGCGRGEMLELLKEIGVEAEGVDSDPDMVAEALRKGLRATCADAVEFLTEKEGAAGAVFSSHVIEHLTADRLQTLIAAAARSLRVGGILMLVSPSPRNLQMHLGEFWMDLTHVRLYSPEGVRFVMHNAGLRDIEISENEVNRLGPDLGLLADGEELPRRRKPHRWLGRLRERWTRLLLPRSVTLRLQDLEARINWIDRWVTSLYPPGEYVVTGIR
jgi:SAM-dependent methyltransferase